MSSRWNDFNRTLIEDMRAHGGHATSGPFKGRDVLILHTKGAKSGKPRETPLAYFPENGHYLVIASKGGAPTHPSWYHNLLANPNAIIELAGPERFQVRATTAGSEERDELAKALPYLGQQQSLTEREIPIVVFERV